MIPVFLVALWIVNAEGYTRVQKTQVLIALAL